MSALATGAIIAAYTVTDSMGIQRSQSTLSYTAWVFASYLLMPFVLLLLRTPVRPIKVEGLPRAVAAGAFSLAAYTLVLWATHYVDVGIVSALRETSVLWAIVLGRLFLREAFTWRRAASAFVICLGIALLVLRSR
jgi:drug/metabolite transporter (DMT)-like permease